MKKRGVKMVKKGDALASSDSLARELKNAIKRAEKASEKSKASRIVPEEKLRTRITL